MESLHSGIRTFSQHFIGSNKCAVDIGENKRNFWRLGTRLCHYPPAPEIATC